MPFDERSIDMFVRKFVCYFMVLTIGLSSVGNLFGAWAIYSNYLNGGTPPSLISEWEVDANYHWSHKVSELVTTWQHRGEWTGSAHPTDVGHTETMTRTHAALTNNPATCRTQLYSRGPTGPPTAPVLQKTSLSFTW